MNTTILIPETAIHTKIFTCVFEPASKNTKISCTLNGEDKPFLEGETFNRSNDISIFLRRPKKLDVKRKQFTVPLKSGDIVNIKVTHENDTVEEQKVKITEDIKKET